MATERGEMGAGEVLFQRMGVVFQLFVHIVFLVWQFVLIFKI